MEEGGGSMNFKAERINIALAGGIIGIISVALVLMGNPANMGFCLACFIRKSSDLSSELWGFPWQEENSPLAEAPLP